MPQLSVRLTDDEKRVLDDTAEKYRTPVSELIRAYIEYLEQGGAPIGYPMKEESEG
jgi:predicted transcriptional regulator